MMHEALRHHGVKKYQVSRTNVTGTGTGDTALGFLLLIFSQHLHILALLQWNQPLPALKLNAVDFGPVLLSPLRKYILALAVPIYWCRRWSGFSAFWYVSWLTDVLREDVMRCFLSMSTSDVLNTVAQSHASQTKRPRTGGWDNHRRLFYPIPKVSALRKPTLSLTPHPKVYDISLVSIWASTCMVSCFEPKPRSKNGKNGILNLAFRFTESKSLRTLSHSSQVLLLVNRVDINLGASTPKGNQ